MSDAKIQTFAPNHYVNFCVVVQTALQVAANTNERQYVVETIFGFEVVAPENVQQLNHSRPGFAVKPNQTVSIVPSVYKYHSEADLYTDGSIENHPDLCDRQHSKYPKGNSLND